MAKSRYSYFKKLLLALTLGSLISFTTSCDLGESEKPPVVSIEDKEDEKKEELIEKGKELGIILDKNLIANVNTVNISYENHYLEYYVWAWDYERNIESNIKNVITAYDNLVNKGEAPDWLLEDPKQEMIHIAKNMLLYENTTELAYSRNEVEHISVFESSMIERYLGNLYMLWLCGPTTLYSDPSSDLVVSKYYSMAVTMRPNTGYIPTVNYSKYVIPELIAEQELNNIPKVKKEYVLEKVL